MKCQSTAHLTPFEKNNRFSELCVYCIVHFERLCKFTQGSGFMKEDYCDYCFLYDIGFQHKQIGEI